jgi:hypothetical protein
MPRRWTTLNCTRCGRPIKRGQMYLANLKCHVACPTLREIAHAIRMGRERP